MNSGIVDFALFKETQKNLIELNEIKIKISGDSMYPLISSDDPVLNLVPIKDLKTLQRFDIIVYWNEDKLLMHYMWKISFSKKKIYCRPLNPICAFDDAVDLERVLGKIEMLKIPKSIKWKIYLTTYLLSPFYKCHC